PTSTFILPLIAFFFFFNATPTPEFYTLSLHDALPISVDFKAEGERENVRQYAGLRLRDVDRLLLLEYAGLHAVVADAMARARTRSEEHTSELQSQSNLVCRLLLEKKNKVHPALQYSLR